MIYITSDVDWAPDEAISSLLSAKTNSNPELGGGAYACSWVQILKRS